ncbi:MAG: peptidylprolyl isomerase [Oleiphilus sp.]|nr:MAG: peptidylprolyl isomerase [Oleiphilus sp.]
MIRVNGAEIDESAILKEMQYHEADTHDKAKNKACEALVVSELLKQKANTQGFEEDVDGYIDHLLEHELEVPEASEEVCRRYYENNQHKFKTSPLVEGRHILIAASESNAAERSEALELANNLINTLQDDPQAFGDLVKQYSRCPSSKTGGHLGQIGKGQTVPEFERQLFNCHEGLADSPIESRYGVHVVWVDHIEPGRALPFEAVQKKIADYLGERLRFKSIAHYIQNLANEAKIEGFELSGDGSPLMQ